LPQATAPKVLLILVAIAATVYRRRFKRGNRQRFQVLLDSFDTFRFEVDVVEVFTQPLWGLTWPADHRKLAQTSPF